MRKLLTLFCILVYTASAFGQYNDYSKPSVTAIQDSSSKNLNNPDINPPITKGNFEVTVGIGYSKLWYAYSGSYLNFSDDPYVGFVPHWISPVYTVALNYGITEKSSLGFNFDYTSATSQYNGNFISPIPSLSEYLTRLNFEIQYIKFVKMQETKFFYFGGRLGISYWTDKVEYFGMPSNLLGLENQFYPSIGASTKTYYNGQAFFGFKFYSTSNSSFHIESGIGTPYIIEAGFSIIFKRKIRK